MRTNALARREAANESPIRASPPSLIRSPAVPRTPVVTANASPLKRRRSPGSLEGKELSSPTANPENRASSGGAWVNDAEDVPMDAFGRNTLTGAKRTISQAETGREDGEIPADLRRRLTSTRVTRLTEDGSLSAEENRLGLDLEDWNGSVSDKSEAKAGLVGHKGFSLAYANKSFGFKSFCGIVVNSYFARRLLIVTLVVLLVDIAGVTLTITGPVGVEDNCILNALMINVVGILNVILALPALGLRSISLYYVHSHSHKLMRSGFLMLCELVIIVELFYSLFVIIWFLRMQAQEDQACFVPFEWHRTIIGMITVFSFFAVWYQIGVFTRFRAHMKLQLGSMRDRDHLTLWSKTGNAVLAHVKWRASERRRREAFRHQLWQAVAQEDLEQVQSLLDPIDGRVDGDLLRQLYSTPTLVFWMFAQSTKNPLHLACSLGNRQIIQALLEKKFPVNALDKTWRIKVSILELFRLTGLFVSSQDRDEGNDFLATVLVSPLHVAVINGFCDIVEMLCEAGADVNILARSSFWFPAARVPPLFVADTPVVVEKLLRHRANILAVAQAGSVMTMTALQHAALKERSAVIPILEEWGGDVALTPLHAAAASGDLPQVSAILASGVDPDTRGEGVIGLYGRTPLHWAAITGKATSIRLLLEYGAEKDALDACMRTPLHWAARHNHIKAVEMLLEASANPSWQDMYGRTVMCTASEVDNVEPDILQALIEAGADINAKCCFSEDTPLHIAVKRNNKQTAIALLQCGASIEETDADGRTPVECTTSAELQFEIKKHVGCLDVLISCGPSMTHSSFLRKLRQAIEAAHVTTWSTCQRETKKKWQKSLKKYLPSTSAVLCILTKDFESNVRCAQELSIAKENSIPVLACSLDVESVSEDLQVSLFTRQIVPFASCLVRPHGGGVNSARSTKSLDIDDNKFQDQARLLVDGLKDVIEIRRLQGVSRKGARSGATALSKATTSSFQETLSKGFNTANFVFISHGDVHPEFVQRLVTSLSEAGIVCFLDSPTQTSDMKERIIQAKDHIKLCSAFLVILSKESVLTELVSDQMAFAEDKGRPIIPVYLVAPPKDIVENPAVHPEDLLFFAEDISFESSFEELLLRLQALTGGQYGNIEHFYEHQRRYRPRQQPSLQQSTPSRPEEIEIERELVTMASEVVTHSLNTAASTEENTEESTVHNPHPDSPQLAHGALQTVSPAGMTIDMDDDMPPPPPRPLRRQVAEDGGA